MRQTLGVLLIVTGLAGLGVALVDWSAWQANRTAPAGEPTASLEPPSPSSPAATPPAANPEPAEQAPAPVETSPPAADSPPAIAETPPPAAESPPPAAENAAPAVPSPRPPAETSPQPVTPPAAETAPPAGDSPPADTAAPDATTLAARPAPDDGPAPVFPDQGIIKIEIEPQSVVIDEGQNNATFKIRLATTSARPIVVVFATLDGSARADSDYERQRGTLTFQPGETELELAVPILDDQDVEGDEEVELLLTADPNVADLNLRRLPLTIKDND